MKDHHILLGITGGIAAYKSAELCRLFVKAGATVQVVMSESATQFITPLTMETLSGRPVRKDMFGPERRAVEHIELADDADIMLIAPATADYLARSAQGRASDLISAVTLAFTKTIVVAPAMNTNMWNNPATQRNLQTLVEEMGWNVVQPGSGFLACGWTGPGRMAEPQAIFDQVASLLAPGDLENRKLLITAGPTIEDIDPVRFLSNRSSGKMGYALAAAAEERGADVTLISGPVNLQPPAGVELVSVRSALEMESAVNRAADDMDAVIMAAAIADYRPADPSESKMKKGADEKERTVNLVQNPDILKGLGKRFHSAKNGPLLVGFAVETENLTQAVKKKLKSKKAHMIVGNLAKDSFGRDTNRLLIIDDNGNTIETDELAKGAAAKEILDHIVKRLS